MSIQTELTRITNAKTAIKTAIEGKGVTVPDGTLLDGMAALIESIEAGGGGGAKTASGTFTLASPAFSHQVTHNLGAVPNFALIWQDIDYLVNSSTMFIGIYLEGRQYAWNYTTHNEIFPVSAGTYDISGTSPSSYPSKCYGIAAYAATNSTVKFGNEKKSTYGFGKAMFHWLVGVL